MPSCIQDLKSIPFCFPLDRLAPKQGRIEPPECSRQNPGTCLQEKPRQGVGFACCRERGERSVLELSHTPPLQCSRPWRMLACLWKLGLLSVACRHWHGRRTRPRSILGSPGGALPSRLGAGCGVRPSQKEGCGCPHKKREGITLSSGHPL